MVFMVSGLFFEQTDIQIINQNQPTKVGFLTADAEM
jgi:hypothetical protein